MNNTPYRKSTIHDKLFDSESDKSDSVEEVDTCEAFCSLCDEKVLHV